MPKTYALWTIADLRPGDHLCCIYETEEEHRAVLTPFVRQGLERGEKVVYIVDIRTAETILSYLRGDGVDVESCLARGQLSILTRDEAYMREGVFDPEGMIGLLRSEMGQALTEGYLSLRVTGEMTWALRGLPGSERLIEYEARLNEFLPGSRCLAICQYDQRRFTPEVLLDVLRTHPIAVIGTEIYDNFYYIPPAELLGHELPGAELRHWVQNLTERKWAEEALQKSEARFRSLFQRMLNGFAYCQIILDDSGRPIDFVYLEINDAFESLTGLRKENVVGKRVTEVIPTIKEQHPELFDIYGAVALTGESTQFEIFFKPLQIWLLISVYCPEPGYFTAVFENITKRKRAEDGIRRLNEELEQQVEERTKELRDAQEQLVRQEKLAVLGQLAGGVGHELRNPLGAIKNAAYFLNLVIEEPEPEVKEILEILEKEVRTSERIISSLLDFARSRSLTRRKVDINDVVQEALSRTSVPEHVEVVRQLDEALPTILADPDQLGQAFGNLLLNAIQAMPEGGRLVIQSEGTGRGDPVGRPEQVVVSFADTGVGIPEENLDKLFEPLFTTKARGIGLGLALTRTLVEGHGGTVEVESEVGKGSTFTVRLPMSGG